MKYNTAESDTYSLDLDYIQHGTENEMDMSDECDRLKSVLDKYLHYKEHPHREMRKGHAPDMIWDGLWKARDITYAIIDYYESMFGLVRAGLDDRPWGKSTK